MPVRVRSAGLVRMAKAVRRVTSASKRRELHALLGQEALKQLDDEFRQSRDPYGRPWAPLKRRAGQPLLDTGRMRASFQARATARGFEVNSAVQYAHFHQDGTRKMVRRQMLPDGNNLGPIWTRAFRGVIQGWMREALGQ